MRKLLLITLLLIGCGDGTEPIIVTPDAGIDADVPIMDAGFMDDDAGMMFMDAGMPDSGSPVDAGSDSGVEMDAGTPDAGMDAGSDSGTPDAGMGMDAGPPDAGFDAGPPPDLCMGVTCEPYECISCDLPAVDRTQHVEECNPANGLCEIPDDYTAFLFSDESDFRNTNLYTWRICNTEVIGGGVQFRFRVPLIEWFDPREDIGGDDIIITISNITTGGETWIDEGYLNWFQAVEFATISGGRRNMESFGYIWGGGTDMWTRCGDVDQNELIEVCLEVPTTNTTLCKVYDPAMPTFMWPV